MCDSNFLPFKSTTLDPELNASKANFVIEKDHATICL